MTTDEWSSVIVGCMNQSGFPVTVMDDGGIGWAAIPESQQKAANAANEVCMQRFPLDPKYDKPLTDKQSAFLYEWYLKSVKCLEQQGITGNTPPSLNTFRAKHGTSEAWTPYVTVPGERTKELEKVCPQGPPDNELYAPELMS